MPWACREEFFSGNCNAMFLNMFLPLQNFRGNQDAVNPVSHLLAQPIITLTLRVKPLSWSTAGACLRLEIFGCQNGEFASVLFSRQETRFNLKFWRYAVNFPAEN